MGMLVPNSSFLCSIGIGDNLVSLNSWVGITCIVFPLVSRFLRISVISLSHTNLFKEVYISEVYS